MRNAAVVAAMLAASALTPVPAMAKGGGQEGGGGGASDSNISMWSTLPGDREVTVGTPMASESLGNVKVTATMWAGTGSAKCRVNFFIENFSSSTVSLGFVGRTFDAKDSLVDNWVISIASLAPNFSAGRLFSCSLGATQFTLVPLANFEWPPVKCVTAKAEGEAEADACPLTFTISSTVPIVLNKEEKKPEAGDKKEDKGGHH